MNLLEFTINANVFELFKFYSKPGAAESINWDYFAKQTVGLSAAHI
jgi:hypothetical protein